MTPKRRIVNVSNTNNIIELKPEQKYLNDCNQSTNHEPIKEAQALDSVKDVLQQWPLESMPIKNAVVNYGLRTAAMQARKDADFLFQIANKISLANCDHQTLADISRTCLIEAKKLRGMLKNTVENQ